MEEINILCLLPEEVLRKQMQLRQKIAQEFDLYDCLDPKIPAHITLKYRFPVHNLYELESSIQEICLSNKPINFKIRGINYLTIYTNMPF